MWPSTFFIDKAQGARRAPLRFRQAKKSQKKNEKNDFSPLTNPKSVLYCNNKERIMEVTKTSPLTGITRTLDLDVTLEEYSAWKAGALIQDAMPRLNADEREFIKTGYTAEDWEEIFAQEED